MTRFEIEKKVISEFLKSIGPWSNHIVIGGGYAPIIYRIYLVGQAVKYPPVGTRDIDSLIPRKIPNTSLITIDKYLKDAGFKVIMKDRETPATEAYVKEIDGNEIEIEFLTDDAARKDKGRNISIAGITAQPLTYLKLSLEKTIKFKTSSNEIGRVVSPGAWMFHKGLTFPKRTSENKVFKDLYGIWYVSNQLGEFSREAISELTFFSKSHPKWFETFRRNLSNWQNDAAPLDWLKLEAQDPFGQLKKRSFQQLIKMLF